MSKYLNTIMKVMPVVQARQVSDLLQNLYAKGQLRNSHEYRLALSELANLVNAEQPKPMYEQLRALMWGLVRSNTHNTMMQTAKNDVEALFLQADEIGQRLDDHHFEIMQNFISSLEHALQDQEDRIRELKMQAAKTNEFSNAVFNSFARTSLKRIERSVPDAQLFFFNNRTSRPVTEKEIPSAYVSEHGDKIVLASKNEPRILPVQAKLLFDEESYGSKTVTSVNNNLSSIIDGTKDTFWSRTVYADSPVEQMSTILEFDLGIGRDVNYCIIEGATTEPFFVTEMYGVGLDGQTIDLLLRRSVASDDVVENDFASALSRHVTVDGWERIDFPQVFVKAIRIKFSYASFKEADYFVPDASRVFSLHEANHPVDMSPSDIAPIAHDLVMTEDMAEICNIPKPDYTHINSNVYTFSLDNVWFGNSLYSDSSLFVSEPVKLTAPGIVCFQAKERNIGVLVEGSDQVVSQLIDPKDIEELKSDSFKNAGSVEYELIRRATGDDGLTKRDHFPIPIRFQTVIVRERLLLTKKIHSMHNDAGALRFCPRVKNREGWVYVFKNGKRLENDEWKWAVSKNIDGDLDPWHLSTSIVENPYWWNFRYWTLSPQKMWIKIKHVDPNDVFTASYVVRTSLVDENDLTFPYDLASPDPKNQPLTPIDARVFLDKQKTVYIGEEGRIHFLPDPETDITRASDLNVQITLRRNAAECSVSPEVLEYLLLSAPYRPGME